MGRLALAKKNSSIPSSEGRRCGGRPSAFLRDPGATRRINHVALEVGTWTRLSRSMAGSSSFACGGGCRAWRSSTSATGSSLGRSVHQGTSRARRHEPGRACSSRRRRSRSSARRAWRRTTIVPASYSEAHADVAQLVEHQLPKLRVVGSSPIVRSGNGRFYPARMTRNSPVRASYSVCDGP